MLLFPALTGLFVASQVAAHNARYQTPAKTIETRLRVDNGTYGPDVEEVHYCKIVRERGALFIVDKVQTTTNGPLE
jgi:hypothetical protein